MNDTLQTPKPVQAGDYGKPISEKLPMTDKAETSNSDGRKTLALWSR